MPQGPDGATHGGEQMKWWMWLLLPVTLPLVLIGLLVVFVAGGLSVVKQTFWPDSLG